MPTPLHTRIDTPMDATGARVLAEAWTLGGRQGLWLRRAVLIALGIALLVLAAKVRVPFWPVPMTMQTFAVLSIGAAFGPRLGGATLLGYLALGAIGLDVFTSSSATAYGLAYMMGGTGGYLLGFLMAAVLLGCLAERGWDRRPMRMMAAMVAGLVLVYLPGVLWLGHLYADARGWAWVLEVGLTTFLSAEVLKVALAMVLFPALWRFVGPARG
ncbi:MAG: biotin transporter BioY [Pseudomonadota bacterium]